MKRFTLTIIFLFFNACGADPTPVVERAIKVVTPYSDSAFVEAIMRGDDQQVDVFLRGKINPNAVNRFGDSALHWTVYNGQTRLTRALLDRGADPNIEGTDRKTPIFWSVRFGNLLMTKLLLAENAKPDLRDQRGSSLLHHAAFSGSPELLDLILTMNLEVDAQDQDGETALHMVIREGHERLISSLIEHGASLDIPNQHGVSPLILAVRSGKQKWLLQNQAVQKQYPDLPRTIDSMLNVVVDNAADQPAINLRRIALIVHDQVNLIRRKHELGELAYDESLARIATEHCKDMARREFIDHVNPDGENPTDRARRRRYPVRGHTPSGDLKMGVGENIYQGHLYRSSSYSIEKGTKYVSNDWLTEQQIATAAVQGWMDSPGHRANLLAEHYSKEGIGLSIGPSSKLFVTQNFW